MDSIIVEDLPDSQSPTIQSPLAAARSDAITHLALAPHFDLTNHTKEEDGKMAEIWALAQQTAKSADIPDIMWEVIHLEGVLGAPRLGESRLDRLYRYAKLKRQEARIQQDLRNVSLGSRI